MITVFINIREKDRLLCAARPENWCSKTLGLVFNKFSASQSRRSGHCRIVNVFLWQKIEFCVGAARLLFTFANRNVYVFDKLLDSHVTCQKNSASVLTLRYMKMLLNVASNPMDCLSL